MIGSDEDDFEGAAKRVRTTKKKTPDEKAKASKSTSQMLFYHR